MSSIPSIFIPSSIKDFWINIYSEISILSWYESMIQLRKKKNIDKIQKLNDKLYKKLAKKRIFNTILIQDIEYECNVWKQVFLDLTENN